MRNFYLSASGLLCYFLCITKAQTITTSEFAAAYQHELMDLPLDINGYEPTTYGTYPLFVYITGTTMSSWTQDDKDITKAMSEKGKNV